MKLLKRNSLATCVQCIRNRAFSSKPTSPSIAPIKQVLEHGTEYGTHTDYFGKVPKKKIIVEFSSPNIAKQFHVGHYRSTLIGHVISNLLRSAGHDVVRVNYLGDWGLQFAYVYLGYLSKFTDAESYEEKLNTVADMSACYVEGCKNFDNEEALKVFEAMERDDPVLMKFWSLCRRVSVKNYEQFYDRLGVNFDEYSGESRYRNGAGVIGKEYGDVVERGEGESLQVDVSGSRYVEGAKKHPGKISLSRRDGTSLYLTRDVVALVERHEKYNFDEMIYVTDSSQKPHFCNVFAAVEALGHDFAAFDRRKLRHVGFGRVRGMKSREGKAQLIEETIAEVVSHHRRERNSHATRKRVGDTERVCEVLALTSLACHDLDRKLDRGYQFRWDALLSTKGRSGLFLQYTHCRLHSLIQNSGVPLNFDLESLTSLEEMSELLHVIGRFPHVVEKCVEELEPCVLVHYLFDLSSEVSRSLIKCSVKRSEREKGMSYLLAFHCAKVTLANGLKMLGVEPLDEM